MKRLLVAAIALLLLTGCGDPFAPQTVTQRSAAALPSDADGRYQSFLARFGSAGTLQGDKAAETRAQAIMDRLKAVVISERPAAMSWVWRVHVPRNPAQITSSFSKTRIVVPTGFLESFKPNDDELAFVIAHEVAHEFLGDANEFLWLLANPSAINDARVRQIEFDADRLGIDIVTKAGYRREGAAALFSRMHALLGPPRGYRYPDYQTRIRALEQAR